MLFSIEPFVTDNILLLGGLLFVSGVVEDVLDTWVTFAVVKRQTVTTGLITFFGIILEFTVFIAFISNLDKWPVIISYAIGATVGSVGVIEFQKLLTRKKKERQKEKRLKGYRKARLAKLKLERAIKTVVSKVKKSDVSPIEKVKVVAKTSKVEREAEKNDSIPSSNKSDFTKPTVESPT